jgi:hypothetical protein
MEYAQMLETVLQCPLLLMLSKVRKILIEFIDSFL